MIRLPFWRGLPRLVAPSSVANQANLHFRVVLHRNLRTRVTQGRLPAALFSTSNDSSAKNEGDDSKALEEAKSGSELSTDVEEVPGALGMPAPRNTEDEELEKQLYVKPPENAVEHVVHATKETFNYAVVVGGVVLIGGLAGTLYYYLFSSSGPQKIFDNSYQLVKMNSRVAAKIGTPIVGKQVSRQNGRVMNSIFSEEYEINGQMHTRIRYVVKGPRGLADIDAEVAIINGKTELIDVLATFDDGSCCPIVDKGLDFASVPSS
mmetsp:Transcript_25926/g.41752  ORF Transcript_25926/g.41752 Transcript_25926/m.41752 type:complete len:264 (-) Transcript_25926:104-895(-)|eukprot:jgi/Bigna1/144223/aug1.85_g18931